MKKKIFSLLLFLVSLNYLHSQCPGTLYITSQAQIDSFATDYEGCTEHLGGIIDISGEDITSLEGLSNLTQIYYLNIHDVPFLLSFVGLDNLNSVHVLSLSGELPNVVSGFSSLSSIGETLRIVGTNITSIQGFIFLANIGSGLEIENNIYLQNIPAFHLLYKIGPDDNSIGSGLKINNNPQLQYFPLFQVLSEIRGPISISGNDALETIEPLSGINSCHGLDISNNASLTSLNGLIDMQNINDSSLNISSNPNLTSLEGIHNINPNSIGSLNLYSSSSLSLCSYSNICTYLLNGGVSNISGNAFGCETISSILSNCNNLDNDTFLKDTVEFYPNPVKDILNIANTSNELDIEILNIFGKKMNFSMNQNGNYYEIDMTNFIKGIYFVKYYKQGINLKILKIIKY